MKPGVKKGPLRIILNGQWSVKKNVAITNKNRNEINNYIKQSLKRNNLRTFFEE